LIHLSIAAKRSTVVQSLINSNIELDVKDDRYRTPLAHASEIGADDCVKALIAAKVEVNDGALHLAARTLNVNTMKMLINNGHSPNQRSSKHQGRTSLAELCLWAPKYAKRSSSEALEKDARKAIRMLMEMGAKTKLKIPNEESGRSLLLHALDSAKPLEMARAFLDCGQDEYINDDFHLFTDREYTYSPTKYVQKGLCRCDPKLHARLIRTLK
jgi:Ankyrin repeats (3 copies)